MWCVCVCVVCVLGVCVCVRERETAKEWGGGAGWGGRGRGIGKFHPNTVFFTWTRFQCHDRSYRFELYLCKHTSKQYIDREERRESGTHS